MKKSKTTGISITEVKKQKSCVYVSLIVPLSLLSREPLSWKGNPILNSISYSLPFLNSFITYICISDRHWVLSTSNFYLNGIICVFQLLAFCCCYPTCFCSSFSSLYYSVPLYACATTYPFLTNGHHFVFIIIVHNTDNISWLHTYKSSFGIVLLRFSRFSIASLWGI